MPYPFVRSRLALQLQIALFSAGAMLLPGMQTAVAAPTVVEGVRQFNIPAGSLTETLSRFADAAGVTLSFSAAQTQGHTSPGLRGSYSVDTGFATLLTGSGLQARNLGGSYALEAVVNDGSIALGATTIDARQHWQATTEGSQSYTSNAVTIGKGIHTLKEIPQSVTVMTRQQMDDQGLVDLQDAVNHSTGVVGAQGIGKGTVLSSRGFQIDAWQYDGVPIPRNNYTLGNWATQDLIFFDRLEILRGASGLLQGTGSPGGAVNMVRKRGQNMPTVTLTGKAGSWDHYGLQLDAGGPLNDTGTVRGRIVADEDQSKSFTDYEWSKTHSLYGALDFDLSDNTTLGMAISRSKAESRPMIRGLPRYADGSMPDYSRSTYVGARWNHSDIDVTTLYADLEHRFNDDWSFKVGALRMTEENQSKQQRVHSTGSGLLADGSGVQYGDFVTDFESTKIALDMNLSGKFEAWSIQQEVMLGGNYSKMNTDDRYARTFTNSSDNIFGLNFNRPEISYAGLLNSVGGRAFMAKNDVYQKGLYGSWRIKPVQDLTLVFGSRISWYDYSYKEKSQLAFSNVVNASNPSLMKETGQFTPYVGAVYDLSREWAVYASYTDVFQPQTARGAGGSILEPVIGSNYEVGLKGELLEGRVNTSLAVFRYDQENRAVNDVASGFACDSWYCSKASGKVRSQGIEAEISGEVIDNLQLFAGYTYNTTKYLEDPNNKGSVFSTWTPKHMLRLWGNYRFTGDWNRLSTGLGVTTQSHTLGYEGTYKVAGYTVWSARLGYQLTPEIALAMNANNLFDKKYVSPGFNTLNGANSFGDPRNLMFTVKYTPQF